MGWIDRLRSFFAGPAIDPEVAAARERWIHEQLERHRRTMWRPVVVAGVADASGSHFGGGALLAAGEDWPVCTKCRSELELVVQIDSNAVPERAAAPFGAGHLQLFLCTRCFPGEPYDPGVVLRTLPHGDGLRAVEIDRAWAAFEPRTIMAWEESAEFPCLGNEEANLDFHDGDWEFVDCHYSLEWGDKLLGWPLWWQVENLPLCPVCQQSMRYIVQIDLGDMAGPACGHVTICNEHPEQLAWGWQR